MIYRRRKGRRQQADDGAEEMMMMMAMIVIRIYRGWIVGPINFDKQPLLWQANTMGAENN